VDPLLHAASRVSAYAAGNLISAVWEGAILAVGVALCLRLMPRLSAASRSVIWMNAFFLLVLLHVLPAFRGNDAESGIAAGRVSLDWRWSLAIAGVWAVLSLWRAAELIVSAVRLHGLAKRARTLEGDATLRALLATRPGGRVAELCTSDEVARPSVLGFFKPRVLLPPGLVEKLTSDELRQVVLHEMEHLRRGDDWTNLLQKVALVFFPLNPALIWVERKLCAERELACDDRVLEAGGPGKAYAICLTRLAEFSMLRRSVSLVLGAWERRPELARRVHRLLRRPGAAMGQMQARFAMAGLIAAVAAGGFTLARSPQLVGFAEPAVSVAATHEEMHGAGMAAYRPVNLLEKAGSAHVVQAKAVMSVRPAVAMVQKAKPVHKRALARVAKPQQDLNTQAWMVLTEWNDLAEQPRPVLLKFDTRGTYAAVPVIGGWLIVKI
jgi:beta-lactamase regulating signal transducer with metallopeptidase domain